MKRREKKLGGWVSAMFPTKGGLVSVRLYPNYSNQQYLIRLGTDAGSAKEQRKHNAMLSESGYVCCTREVAQ